ncbi:hypothetical protein JYQ62_19700 [Nostoc sp. UHCC 0702]|nr:hypothetical protein JYQ62_19700 [Nostoc sp. UHCC 0702]
MSCRNAIACASCVHYSIHLYSILAIACASCVSPDVNDAMIICQQIVDDLNHAIAAIALHNLDLTKLIKIVRSHY